MLQTAEVRLTQKEKARLKGARPILDIIRALMVELAIPPASFEFVRLILAGSVAFPEQAEANMRYFREVLDNLVEEQQIKTNLSPPSLALKELGSGLQRPFPD